MNKYWTFTWSIFIAAMVMMGCTVSKKKNETSALGKVYHNTTAYYNGYWNAKEILKENMIIMRAANVDDFNQIIEVEDYVSLDNPKQVKPDMDKIIDKVSTVAQLHEPSSWVDDCYVMMAKAQYLKQEYETAEETLQYFEEDFNPSNPNGRNYKSKKPKGKALKKLREQERKENEEKREKEKDKKDDERQTEKAKKDLTNKEKAKVKEEEKKAKEKAKKEKAKQKKSGKKKPAAEKSTTVTDPKTAVSTPDSNIKVSPLVKKVEDKKEEDIETPKVVKPEEDETAYSEGILWLSKTYIKRQNWYSAEALLRKLAGGTVNDDVAKEVPATFASLYIKQKRYHEALPKLKEAIEMADKNFLKGRYAFIAGQVSQEINDYSGAMDYFATAKKYTNSDKMEFMSKLATAKNGLISGRKSRDQVIADLLDMTKEDKYIEQRDQIFFTLADIEFAGKNNDGALAYFKQSSANNISNQKLKSETFLKIATIYYQKEAYLDAASYYDSTLTVMTNKDERYGQVQKYASNLKEIAFNLDLIKSNDTLLYFAELPEDKKKDIITKYLDAKRINVASSEPSTEIASPKKDIVVGDRVDFGQSKFFAYNRDAKNKGKEVFGKAWRNRPLEDNWRRSAKSSSGNKEENSPEKDLEKIAESDAKKQDFKKEEYEKFIRTLPNNPVRKQEVYDKTMSAMFVLGKLFRDKISNYTKSAETLEEMHKRYGPTPNELDSYYYLYLDYTDLNNSTKADEYKSKISRKYPDSKYTAILNDPNYFKKNKINQPEEYYKSIYELFEKGQYVKVLEAINNAPNVLPKENNPYIAKMALLKAMCIGNRDGKDAYAKALNDVIVTYPNTPEQFKAKEIMRFLGGDKGAFNSLNVEDVDKLYQKEDDQLHYVAIVTYSLEEAKHVNMKVSISEYNKKNFKVERLQMGDAALNIEENSQIILIRKFENAAKAMDYYKKANAELEEFGGNVGASFDILPISQRNYRKLLSERSSKAYLTFFEINYLQQK